MPQPLLATKLFIPAARPGLVIRPRLVQKLDHGRHSGSRLSLLSAPAGYGKTTLAREWLSHLETLDENIKFAWLSLDDSDNEPGRFLHYFLAALQKASDQVGREAMSLLEMPGSAGVPMDDCLTLLINDLAAQPLNFVLVLDDYHLIQNLVMHQWLEALLENLPPNLHLVLTTRADPLLHLPRLRARRQMTEIRSAEMRFTLEEASAFLLDSMNLKLSADSVSELENETEGWIAGLQLAALSLEGVSDPAEQICCYVSENRYVVDYLFEEVFCRQTEAMRNFLVKTSILERLTAGLCEAVVDSADGLNAQAMLEELERANLFLIPQDNQRRWFRYHHLFADLLRQQLRQQASSAEISQLYAHASAWYEENGYVSEAIDTALISTDRSILVRLLEQYGLPIITRNARALPEAWLSAFTETELEARPMLCVVAAFNDLVSRPVPPGPMEESIARLIRSIETHPESGDLTQNSSHIRGYLLALQAAVGRIRDAEPQAIITQASEALQLLPEDAWLARINASRALFSAFLIDGKPDAAQPYIEECIRIARAGSEEYHFMSVILSKSSVHASQGRLYAAIKVCRDTLENIVIPAETRGWSYVGAGLHHYLLGRFAVEQNDLNTAEALLVESLERIRFLAEPYVKMRAWCWLAKIHFLQGKMAAVENDLAQSRRCLPGRDLYAINFETRFELMRAAPAGLEKAVLWARSVQLEPQNFRRMRSMILEGEWFFLSQMTLARVMIAQRAADTKFDLDPLFTALQNQQQVAEECTWHERVMEIMILRAMACTVTGQKEAAREALLQALALTANEPYVRLYVDEGEPMRLLLQDCRSRADRSLLPTIDALLNQFHAEKETPAAKAHDPQAGLIEHLTERELEVLGLIAAGLSNAEIAARIYLSPNTLKAHTQSIYAKLDAHSRVQAVNRARELGLIASASN